ncbi:hypothetical protein EVAR_12197_1 [Eumeta japonica]|uniref:Uncharacterized protein n=1 Tax=Eumeta variegata TaxID=151549 RepID=A0A4C1UH39_EUMVA|nr:hypothetical protein EVAR_12197_1 [Eumeta japonica]
MTFPEQDLCLAILIELEPVPTETRIYDCPVGSKSESAFAFVALIYYGALKPTAECPRSFSARVRRCLSINIDGAAGANVCTVCGCALAVIEGKRS